MQHQNTVFHALLKGIPRHRFSTVVGRFGGDYRVRRLDCWSQFVAMIYAQLSGAQSLRELEAALGSHSTLLYHLGLKGVRRSTLSDANRCRPAALFAAVFDLLLPRMSAALARQAGEVLRLIDATPIKLNETLSRWARFSHLWTSAKLHVVYDPLAACPTYFAITPAKVNDIVVAKRMPIEPGATYVFDKAYYDFAWWAQLQAHGCRFVTRLKANSPARCLTVLPVAHAAILSDRIIRLNERMARNRKNPYQQPLREIVVRVDETRTLRLVSNDLGAPAEEIAALYKTRWQIELFFKWVKQNLKLRRFLGTSENAVKIQIITALIAYLLIRLAQQAWPTALSMQRLARLIKANLMHRKSIPDLLHPPPRNHKTPSLPQLTLALNHA